MYLHFGGLFLEIIRWRIWWASFEVPRQWIWDLLSQKVFQLTNLVPLLVGVLIILSKVVQFQYKKQQNRTKQIVNYHWSSKVEYRKLFCHTFFWNVKTVISQKTCDCNKVFKSMIFTVSLLWWFDQKWFQKYYGAFKLLKQRNFMDRFERVLKCLSKIWLVRSRRRSQSLQNWSYFVCIYFNSFYNPYNIISTNASSNNSFLQQRDLDTLQ